MLTRSSKPAVALGLLSLFLFAAAYMWLGLFLPLNWADEGVIVYAMWRVAEGELPYRDFHQIYGPSGMFLGGLLLRVFGPDLAVLRWFLLALKAAISVMVYLAARRVADRAFACLAFGLSVVLSGLASPVSTIPYPSFFGTALCLAGLLGFLGLQRRFLVGCAVAGACFGLATTFKQTTGAFAFVALALFLLVDRGEWGRLPGKGLALLVRASRWMLLSFAAGLSIFYLGLAPRNPPWNLALLLSPVLFLTGTLALRELRGGSDPASQLRSFWGTLVLSLAFLAPLAAYGALFVSLGAGSELFFGTVSGLPGVSGWISPYPTPTLRFVLWQVACLGGFASAVLWRRGPAAGGRTPSMWACVGLAAASLAALGVLALEGWQARGEAWWFWGSTDLLSALPFVLVWLSLALMIRPERAGTTPEPAERRRAFLLFTCYGAMALLWLFPAADIWHVLPLVPSCAPLLAHLLDRFWHLPDGGGRGLYGWRAVAGGLIAAFGLALLVPSVHDVLRERGEPGFSPPLPRATGVRGGGTPLVRNGGRLVRYLVRGPRREQPIFVLSGKPLIYFLADRVSPLQDVEYFIYLAAYDLIREEAARELVDEGDLMRRLREVRPLIVADGYDRGTENVRRMYPRLAQFIDDHYRLDRRFGQFWVLRWDPKRARP